MEIERGKTTFRYGFSEPQQMLEWMDENPDAVGVCFVGRSNVGKSSSINALFGNSTARISKTPGRTREINVFTFEVREFPDQTFFLFDLPGYGFAKVAKHMSANWNELIGNFFTNISTKVIVANIQDARHPNQAADIDFSKYITKTDLSTFLILNKIDKLKKQKERAALNKVKIELLKQYKNVKQIHYISAESKSGVKELEQSLITTLLEMSNN